MDERPIGQSVNEGGMNDTGHETPSPKESAPGSIGPVVGIVIIVAVLILGGLYYWGVQLNKEKSADEIRNLPDETLESLETQGTSDTLEAIEADLDATNLDGIDSELDQIENELNNL